MAAADATADEAVRAVRVEARPRAPDDTAWTSARNVASADKAKEPAVQDAPAHEAAAAGEERGEGGGLTSPHASSHNSRGQDVAL